MDMDERLVRQKIKNIIDLYTIHSGKKVAIDLLEDLLEEYQQEEVGTTSKV